MVALIRRAVAAAALAAALLVVPASAGAAQLPGCAKPDVPGGEWQGYGRDLANSRTQFQEKVLGAADAATLTPAWTFSTVKAGGGGDITGTPVVVDGCMYVASSEGWVFAVNADDGKLVWKAQVPYGGRMNASVFVADRPLPGATSTRAAGSRCRTCLSRRNFGLRIPRKVRGSRVTSARVYVRGKRRTVVRGRRLRSRVNLRTVPAGRFRVTIVVRTANGKTRRLRRTYRTCAPKRTSSSRKRSSRKRSSRKRARKAQRLCPAKKRKTRKTTRRTSRRKARRSQATASAAPGRAGTVYVAVTRLSKEEGCPAGDPCIGPYVAAFDQASGALVWATRSLDDQAGADAYATPVVHDGVLMIGVSGGSAELGDEADRYAFQGSMSFLDASSGEVLKKTWTIHPPHQPDDEFGGAGIWSTPAVDPEADVAYVGTANPFKPQAEHPFSNAVVKFDIDRASSRFGQIIGHYKGNVDEYFPAVSELPCYDFPGNNPPFYPQGIGSCGDIDLDFGASPNLFTDKNGRKLVGAGQKSGVYHVFDAETMEPVWSQIVGPPGALGGIVGSTAHDGEGVYGPITLPGYVWGINADGGSHRWIGPVLDGVHWGPPVAAANGVVYTVDFNGFLDAFDARTGVLLTRKPMSFGGGGQVTLSWAGVSVARNMVYAAVGVLGLAEGYVTAYRHGAMTDVVTDATEAGSGGGGGGGGDDGGGGGEPSTPVGPSIVSGPGAASAGYATPTMIAQQGGSLNYVNLDVVQHDVVADEAGPDGQPLFRTPLLGFGQTAPVPLDKVQAGRSYGFFCSLHPNMRGTLQVQ
jgi:outer membrane protein assembly factor BamB/plastocyanin